MKEFDEFDKRIENILKADIYEPTSYTNSIVNALSKKNKRKIISFPKLVAAIIAGAMFISGVVYAKQIEKFIRRFFNNSKGVDTAVENGYIETIYTELYTTSNTKINLSNLLVDDYNICFILDFNFTNELKQISSIIIQDLLITDDNNNILFCKDKTKFNEFCSNNNLDYDYYNFQENFINASIFKSETYHNNRISYNIKSTAPYKKFNNLFIEFNNIILKFEDGNTMIISDKWNTKIDIADDFKQRQVQSYNQIETNDNSINFLSFNTYNTSTIFEFETKFNNTISDNLNEEEINLRESQFIDWCIKNKNEQIKNIYLKNSNGQKFNVEKSNYDDSEIAYNIDGTFHYKATLDLTQYDMTDELTLYFTIHTIYEDKDVVIKLQKSTE